MAWLTEAQAGKSLLRHQVNPEGWQLSVVGPFSPAPGDLGRSWEVRVQSRKGCWHGVRQSL